MLSCGLSSTWILYIVVVMLWVHMTSPSCLCYKYFGCTTLTINIHIGGWFLGHRRHIFTQWWQEGTVETSSEEGTCNVQWEKKSKRQPFFPQEALSWSASPSFVPFHNYDNTLVPVCELKQSMSSRLHFLRLRRKHVSLCCFGNIYVRLLCYYYTFQLEWVLI